VAAIAGGEDEVSDEDEDADDVEGPIPTMRTWSSRFAGGRKMRP
jgi:hypothetical protein